MKKRRELVIIFGLILYFTVAFLPLLGLFSDKLIFSEIMMNSRRLLLLANSIKLGVTVSLVSGIIGLLGALYIYNSRFSKKIYRYFFVTFLPIPYYIYALSWMYLIRFLATIWPEVLRYSMQGYTACLFVEVMTYIPISALFSLVALETMNANSIDMASVYHKGEYVFSHNILKEIHPFFIAGVACIFLLSVTDFSVPSMFQYNTYMLEIYSVYSRTGNVLTAGAMSIPMIVLLILPLILIQRAIRNISVPQNTNRIAKISYSLYFRIIIKIAFFVLLFQLLIPIILFIGTVGSFDNMTKSFFMIYEQLGVSLGVAVITAGIVGFLIIIPAFVLSTSNSSILWGITLIGMAVPGAFQAMGLLKVINGSVIHGVSNTMILPAIGNSIRYMPFSILVLVASMKRIDKKKLELAKVFAVKKTDAFKVYLRMLTPGMVCSMLLSFFFSLGEEGIALVLMPPGRETATVKIYNYLHYGASEFVSGFCLVICLFVLFVESGCWWFLVSNQRLWKK